MRLFVLIAALVGGAAVVYVFALKPATVSIAAVTRGSAAEVVYATGTVEPEYWAKVTPLVRNRLVETCDCEGETVAEGHVLAHLDDVEARAQLSELVAQEDYLHKETDRMIALLARGVVSTERYDDMSSKLLQAQALVAAQRERLADYTITAPLGGVVLRMDGEVGEVVEPGDIVAWVGRPKPLQVIAEVDEEDIPRVAAGQEVLMRADAFADRVLHGTISSITPKGDPVNKTYRVYVALPEDTPLFIGMTVEINIVIQSVEEVLLIPTAALSGSHVYVVEDGRAARRELTLGIIGAENTEVKTGLSEGETVVSPLIVEPADGNRVRVSRGG